MATATATTTPAQQSPSGIVPVAKKDYLKEDPPLRGQNFCCVSFVSPEDVIHRKDVFEFTEFTKQAGADMLALLQGLQNKFRDEPDVLETLHTLHERYSFLWNPDDMQSAFAQFRSTHADQLHRTFSAKNRFGTSVRGFKVRGVTDTYEEALARCEYLAALDNHAHHVYVAQVGCWCPWQPDPAAIRDARYDNDVLNTLMKQYEENMEKKNETYEARVKEQKRALIRANREKKKRTARLGGAQDEGREGDHNTDAQEQEQEQEDDVEEEKRIERQVREEDEKAYTQWVERGKEAAAARGRRTQDSADPEEGGSSVQNVAEALEGLDPWMQRREARQQEEEPQPPFGTQPGIPVNQTHSTDCCCREGT